MSQPQWVDQPKTIELLHLLEQFCDTVVNIGLVEPDAAETQTHIAALYRAAQAWIVQRDYRVCTTCKETKHRDEFYLRPNGTPKTSCKQCDYKRNQNWKKRQRKTLTRVRPGLRKASAWTMAMLAALDDGEWHPVKEIVDVGALTVPPGRAIRTGQRERQKNKERYDWNRSLVDEQDIDALQRRGSRFIARGTLYRHVELGRIELDNAKVRLNPGFPIHLDVASFENTSESVSSSVGLGGDSDSEDVPPTKPDSVGGGDDEHGDRVLSAGVEHFRTAVDL